MGRQDGDKGREGGGASLTKHSSTLGARKNVSEKYQGKSTVQQLPLRQPLHDQGLKPSTAGRLRSAELYV